MVVPPPVDASQSHRKHFATRGEPWKGDTHLSDDFVEGCSADSEARLHETIDAHELESNNGCQNPRVEEHKTSECGIHLKRLREKRLQELEAELTRPVQQLLEFVVEVQSQNNDFQMALDQAHARYRERLTQARFVYEQARMQHGSLLDDRQPYLDAVRASDAAAEVAQAALGRFSAAAQRHAEATLLLRGFEDELMQCSEASDSPSPQLRTSLSGAVTQLAHCCEDRTEAERLYLIAREESECKLKAVQELRAKMGSAAAGFLGGMEHFRAEVAKEQDTITELEEKVRRAKAEYKFTMQELERISMAVHAARSEHAAASGWAVAA